jgi:hypothetical protein
MDDLVAQAVREIEEEQELNRKSGISVFRSMLNQPALVSISSANANFTGSSESFSEFRVDLPRPILKVDTIQLLNANIPECTQNIPDTACVFWYYRLNSYYGAVPNPQNLYMVRLLPSYYKPEFGLILPEETSIAYGFNRTFFDYQDVADELVKSCQEDLLIRNLTDISTQANQPTISAYYPDVPFSPNDIEIKFDTEINRFRMTGMNAKLPLISFGNQNLSTDSYVTPFEIGINYELGEYVVYGGLLYISLVDPNLGHYPTPGGNSFWGAATGDIVYNPAETYAKGDFVTYGGFAWRSLVDNNLNNTPDVTVNRDEYWAFVQDSNKWIRTWSVSEFYPKGAVVYYAPTFSFWVAQRNNINSGIPNIGNTTWSQFVPPVDGTYNRYLIAGYDDPNVAIRQGTQLKTWNPYNTFSGQSALKSSAIQYNGYAYTPSTLGVLINIVPFNYPVSYVSTYNYLKGDLTSSGGSYYEALLPSINISVTNTFYWRVRTDLTWSSTKQYVTGDVVISGSYWYVALQPSRNQNPPVLSTAFYTDAYWQTALWVRNYDSGTIADIVSHAGLNDLSGEYDMLDFVQIGGVDQYRFPFPFGIPGQPFNPAPKRLLNSILGFTWNGQMNVSSLATYQVFNVNTLTNTTLIQLYNRLRPVPPYISAITETGDGLGETEPVQSIFNPTFTANGYANLVYTSVVSIYGSIAGARTLDSQRNTSLLGLTSMNADNLGVSFYGNYIESELIANEEDLYSISIQLFDEFNEPFVLTNNAVVTLTFKMTYKNK